MNKNKSTELDVDFIGGQGPLTKSEEQSISEFIKAQKLLRIKKQVRKTKTSVKTKVTA
jgi:hypothetical protein